MNKYSKIYVIALFFLVFQITKAQEETINNSFVLGGALNLGIQKNAFPIPVGASSGLPFFVIGNDTKNTNFSILPYFGKEVNKHLLVGFELNFRTGKYIDRIVTGEIVNTKIAKQIGGGFFMRYLLNPEKRFIFYLQPYSEYSFFKEENTSFRLVMIGSPSIPGENTIENTRKINFVELGIKTGMIYNINNKVRAVLRIGGLQYVNGKIDGDKKYNSFDTNFNTSSVFFGFELKF